MNEITDFEPEVLSYNNDFELSTEIVPINEEPVVSPEAIFYLLDVILKKKKELHDPRHRCSKFFAEIRELLMIEHGLCYNAITLEKKFHSLKRHFDTLCENRKRNNVKGPIAWRYYGKMMEIFAEELDIEDAPTMASLYPALPLPKSALPQFANKKKENVVEPRFFGEEQKPAVESIPDETKDTPWNHAVLLDFLDECIARKADFWDPQPRRRQIFADIRDRMKAKGYTFHPDNLDRKLRNLKICYLATIKAKRAKVNPKNNRYRWPYFAKMHELYDGYKEQIAVRKRSVRKQVIRNGDVVRRRTRRKAVPRQEHVVRRRSRRKLPTSKCTDEEDAEPPVTKMETSPAAATNGDDQPTTLRSKLDPFLQFHQPAPDYQSSYVIIEHLDEQFEDQKCELSQAGDFDFIATEDESRTDEMFEAKTNGSREIPDDGIEIDEDLEFAQKLLALEQRRTAATEELLELIKESNCIRERKLEFNRMKLSYLMSRAKRKQVPRRNGKRLL